VLAPRQEPGRAALGMRPEGSRLRLGPSLSFGCEGSSYRAGRTWASFLAIAARSKFTRIHGTTDTPGHLARLIERLTNDRAFKRGGERAALCCHGAATRNGTRRVQTGPGRS
jgi:hypothetical protein